MNIVFMGTPDFAVPSLIKLIDSPHKVIGVVTQPDRPKGRGLKLTKPPVKKVALEADIPLEQPDQLKSDSFLNALQHWNAELFVVVGFRILPPVIFEMPPKGTVNLHASLLPKYRGAAPIQWALMNGDRETGVTTFFIQKKVDTGKIILQRKTAISENETAGELHDRMAKLGAEVIIETVDMIASGCVHPIPQQGNPVPAPKILHEHCEINWGRSARTIANQVRALSPAPGAFTFLRGKRLKIFQVSVIEEDAERSHEAGTVLQTGDKGVLVQASSGKIWIKEVQVEGKRRMKSEDFLRGHNITAGTKIGKTS
jgi:methionyl-tRNA formyltransferase